MGTRVIGGGGASNPQIVSKTVHGYNQIAVPRIIEDWAARLERKASLSQVEFPHRVGSAMKQQQARPPGGHGSKATK